MAGNSRLLKTLRAISNTSRNFSHPVLTVSSKSTAPTVLRSLPEHKSLLPLLLSYNVPPKLAKECAARYDRYASQLRSETETRLVPYFTNRRKNPPTTVYPIFLNNYNRTLRRWSQSILDIALKTLKRDSVELRDWEVTYPAPLWLPLPPSPVFKCRRSKEICPFSSASTPAHAFPTTYPPPLRPIPTFPTVEWPRKPVASPRHPPTSIIDLDSLCIQFSKSLVIDESPKRPRQPVVSIFSPSAAARVEPNPATPSKTTLSRSEISHKLPPTKLSTPSLKTAKHCKLSARPPFPSATSRIKPILRKASAPARASLLKPAAVPPKSSDSTYRITPTTPPSPLNTTTAALDIYTYPDPSTPSMYPQSPCDLTLGQITHTSQDLPYSLNGPTTPPASLPDLFSEPVVVPSIPLHLFPGSSLVPISDHFIPFQLQSDYLLNVSQVSSPHYSGFSPGLTAGGFSKSVSDLPLGADYFSYNIPTTMTSGAFENNFVNTHAVF